MPIGPKGKDGRRLAVEVKVLEVRTRSRQLLVVPTSGAQPPDPERAYPNLA